MNIATGSVINMAPAGHDWAIAFDFIDDSPEIVCPVVGWATTVLAHLNDGTIATSVQPVFLYVDMLWTPAELREHTPELGAYNVRRAVGFEPVGQSVA
ncbi:hypothetical protein ABZ504_03060 [Streptomyces mirabilis]|uniref:hypothetical protein n=1 Tax=Streptomyces mirabilis TaxID=68239 RepID=UPI0033FDDA92